MFFRHLLNFVNLSRNSKQVVLNLQPGPSQEATLQPLIYSSHSGIPLEQPQVTPKPACKRGLTLSPKTELPHLSSWNHDTNHLPKHQSAPSLSFQIHAILSLSIQFYISLLADVTRPWSSPHFSASISSCSTLHCDACPPFLKKSKRMCHQKTHFSKSSKDPFGLWRKAFLPTFKPSTPRLSHTNPGLTINTRTQYPPMPFIPPSNNSNYTSPLSFPSTATP